MKTVNLQLSKQLKEAGYPQISAFDWVEIDDNEYLLMGRKNIQKIDEGCISAPTADEILDRLPRKIEKSKNAFWLQVETMANGKDWACQYRNYNMCLVFFEEMSIANAAALMWLYLKKEGLV